MPLYLNGSTGISGVDGTALVPAFQGANTGAGVYYSANSVVFTSNVSIGSSGLTPFAGFKNKIINGNFDFWQRGTSVTGVTNNQYLADRWARGGVGTTGNVSRQSFTLGQTDVPGEPTYFHRSVVTSVAGAGNYFTLYQPIESVRTFAGQTATLSFWAKADASKNIAIEFYQYFGSGGSPSAGVSGIGVTTCALTTSWQKFTVTTTIPSISGKTLGSNGDDFLSIGFWFDSGSTYNSRNNSLGQQSGTFDIAQVQIEAGSVATPFEMRPLQAELALCQRYYFVKGSGNPILFATRANGSDTSRAGYFKYPVTMRAAPTVSVTLSSGTPSVGTDADSARIETTVATSSSVTELSTLTASIEL